jgi:hypothetical protein
LGLETLNRNRFSTGAGHGLIGRSSNLAKGGKTFTWRGGEKGEHGIQRFVPQVFGAGFSNHLEQVIEHELALFAEKAKEDFLNKGK